ncbi:MAG: outer membrane protein assembly factor BamB family protein, partial [Verrucomicrobiales bacterium]
IFIGSNANTFTALTPTAGEPKLKWTYTADDWIDATAMIGDDGTVYVGTYDSTLVALNPDTGEVRWKTQVGADEGQFGVIQASPALASDGQIIVSTSAGFIHGILPTGEEAWFFEIGADTRSSPAIGLDGRIYFGADDGKVYCLDATGQLVWSYAVDGAGEDDSRIYSSPSMDRVGNIYVGSGNGFLYSLDSAGQLRWKFETPEAVDVCPAIDSENNVYFATRNGSLHCVSQEGVEQWSKFLGDIFYSSPVIDANGFVYITYFAGQGRSFVVAFTPGGQEVWQTEIASVIDSSLVLTAEGTLLVGAFDGKVYALEGGAPLDYTLPWPRFRRDTRGRGRVIEGALPTIIEGLSPLALAQAGVGSFSLTSGDAGDRYAWRRAGETIASTVLSSLSVGPITLADVGIYDVIISNDHSEVLAPSTFLTQVSMDGAGVDFTYPGDLGIGLFQSTNLIDWTKDGLSLSVTDDPSAGLQTASVSLLGEAGYHYVRLSWEP